MRHRLQNWLFPIIKQVELPGDWIAVLRPASVRDGIKHRLGMKAAYCWNQQQVPPQHHNCRCIISNNRYCDGADDESDCPEMRAYWNL